MNKNQRKREERKLAREVHHARKRAIVLSMEATCRDLNDDDEDAYAAHGADAYNLLDDAMPDRDSAKQMAWTLYSLAFRAVRDAAQATGQEPHALLRRYLRIE